MTRIRVGVLTVSDRCSRGEAVDLSGPAIIALLSSDSYFVVKSAIVADEKKLISATLRKWADDLDCDVVLTTGGTGLSPRDVTPEATLKIIDRSATNITAYLQAESTRNTPFAALGRGIAGIRKSTLIVNLPGSPKGAKEQASLLIPLLPHAVELLRDKAKGHPE